MAAPFGQSSQHTAPADDAAAGHLHLVGIGSDEENSPDMPLTSSAPPMDDGLQVDEDLHAHGPSLSPAWASSAAPELETAELAARCATETRRFRYGTPHTERYCFALFRRALVERDERAWAALYDCYAPLARAWTRRWYDDAEDVDSIVNVAFARLWRAIDPAKFERFPDLASLLQYFKLCVRGAILDERRAGSAWETTESWQVAQERHCIAEPVAEIDLEASVVEDEVSGDFWAQVRREVPGEREQLLLRLSFVEGLRPREVCRRYPAQFSSVAEIYHLKFAAVERLRQSPILRNWRMER
jgi:RNA polymerase sigma factor (sigma-70 family)